MLKIKKEFIRVIFSVYIVITVISISTYSTIVFIRSVLESDSIFEIARNHICMDKVGKKTYDPLHKKYVVLRLDDVQAHAWSDISMKMIRDAYGFGAPMVAGVVPRTLMTDRDLVNFLKREDCNIEIALHGWDHSGGPPENGSLIYKTEFGSIDANEALMRLKQGMKVIEKISDQPVITFIPPFNVISPEGRKSLEENGISVISSLGTGTYDYAGKSYDYDRKLLIDPEKTALECKEHLQNSPFCVVMLHPQDYANNENQLDEATYEQYYLRLLKKLQSQGVEFITFRDMK